MQIFGLDTSPEVGPGQMYDCHVATAKLATEACELLYGRAYSMSAEWLSKPVPGPDGQTFQSWKSVSKGHAKHPCFYWVCADEHHAWWTLQHALAICKEYTARSEESKTSITEYHLRHILAHTKPPTSPCTFTVSDFETFLSNLLPDDPNKVAELVSKTCTVNPPKGCSFGILACNPSYAVKTDAGIDWVASYRTYYDSKRLTFKKPDVHLKRKREPYVFER